MSIVVSEQSLARFSPPSGVMLSLTAAGVSTALFMFWLVVFQTSWKAWEWSTDIMVSVPDSDLSGW